MKLLENIQRMNEEEPDEELKLPVLEEYEVVVEGPVFGVCVVGPYELAHWDFSGIDQPGAPHRLILSIGRHPDLTTDVLHRESWSDTHLRGGDMSDEFVVLASLFLRRRVKLVQLVRHAEYPLRPSPYEGLLDPELHSAGGVNLSDMMPLMGKLPGLDEDLRRRFLLAARLYHQAVHQIESAPDLAFLALVQAVDVVACAEDAQHIKGGRAIRFAQFVSSFLSEDFWASQEERIETPGGQFVTRNNVEDVARRMYEFRKEVLEKAAPFPDWFYRRGSVREDGSLPPDLPPGELLPYPRFAERVAHFVLVRYLELITGSTGKPL